jgi:hypothetical protein
MEAARGYLDRAENIMAAQFGENSMMAATVFANRGVMEQRMGHAEVAAAQYRKALDALGSGGSDLDRYRHLIMQRYAQVLKSSHHKREAAEVLAQDEMFRSAK